MLDVVLGFDIAATNVTRFRTVRPEIASVYFMGQARFRSANGDRPLTAGATLVWFGGVAGEGGLAWVSERFNDGSHLFRGSG